MYLQNIRVSENEVEFAMISNVFRWVHKSHSLSINYNAKKELYYFPMATRYYMLKIPSAILKYVISWSWSVVGDGYHEDQKQLLFLMLLTMPYESIANFITPFRKSGLHYLQTRSDVHFFPDSGFERVVVITLKKHWKNYIAIHELGRAFLHFDNISRQKILKRKAFKLILWWRNQRRYA